MDTANPVATVGVVADTFFDRGGTQRSFTPINLQVICQAMVRLQDLVDSLVDSAVWSAIESTGGWTYFDVSTGGALVYK